MWGGIVNDLSIVLFFWLPLFGFVLLLRLVEMVLKRRKLNEWQPVPDHSCVIIPIRQSRLDALDERMKIYHRQWADSNDKTHTYTMRNWAIDNGYTDIEITESSDRINRLARAQG